MTSLFMNNSNEVRNARIIESKKKGNVIIYNENDKIRTGEFCYLMLDNDQEFLGEILDIDYTDDGLVVLFVLGIDGREYGFLLSELDKHLTIEKESTQVIERIHDEHCKCGCQDHQEEERFEVFDEDDCEDPDDEISMEVFEKISQMTGMLADMTQDDAAVEMYNLKKSVF